MNELLEIQIDNYEGPLDLLIHLVHKNEMNIFDVPISKITEHFIDEIKHMQKMDMEIAADFINMASYLIHLKSRSMLPKGTTVGEEITPEEEGFNLAQLLIELSYCKDLVTFLNIKRTKSSLYLTRREQILIPLIQEGKLIKAESNPFQLAAIFFGPSIKAPEEKVVIISTKNRSDAVKSETEDILKNNQETLWSQLESIFKERFDKAVAFSTVLTLSKQKLVYSIQNTNFCDILIKRIEN